MACENCRPREAGSIAYLTEDGFCATCGDKLVTPTRNVITANDLWKELVKLIDMPKHCISFTIHAPAKNLPVIIDAECSVDQGTGETFTKRYNLVECDD